MTGWVAQGRPKQQNDNEAQLVHGAPAGMQRLSSQPMPPSFGTTNSTGSLLLRRERKAAPDQ